MTAPDPLQRCFDLHRRSIDRTITDAETDELDAMCMAMEQENLGGNDER